MQTEHNGKEKAIFLVIAEAQPILPEGPLHRRE